MEPKTIEIKNARQHNLQSITLSLPRNSLICFTGVSGSGKSSLAFDTLFAEGQRRYIESLSSYARQFMGQMQKPDCDLITGLSPAIAIQQKTAGWNPRSTVGTITAIYDFLRVLFARIGVQHCTQCGRPITAQSSDQIVAGILVAFGGGLTKNEDSPPGGGKPRGQKPAARQGRRILILAPVARGQKGEFRDLFDDLIRAGYVRARVDGEVIDLTDDLALQKNQRHDIEVVIDRLAVHTSARSRIAESVQSALSVGKGTLLVVPMAGDSATTGRRKQPKRTAASADKVFSSQYACPHCSISFEPPSPQMFSFNSPAGMCMTCDGLGELHDFDPDLLVPDPSKNFWAPCIAPMRTKIGRWRRHIYQGVARALDFDLKQPWNKLPQKARDALLYGTGDQHITYSWRWSRGVWKHGGTFDGVIEELREKYRKARAGFVRAYYEKYMRKGTCPDCRGARLNPQALAVRLSCRRARSSNTISKTLSKSLSKSLSKPPSESPSQNCGTGVSPVVHHRTKARATRGIGISSKPTFQTGPNLAELCSMSIAKVQETLDRLVLSPVQHTIADEVLKEVRARLKFLLNVGLDYLTLDRTAPSLSGGELQRIRLAGQIGSGLTGVLYILDEPSIGLHARDNQRLLESLAQLRDMGNTVIVVEHDEATMRAADYLVDFGPGPGVRGGQVVAAGTLEKVLRSKESLTGRYLRGESQIKVPRRRPVKQRQ